MAVAFHKKKILKEGSAFIYSWFYTQVRNRGPWDYKKLSPVYEAFGNFNYGAAGIAAGVFRKCPVTRSRSCPDAGKNDKSRIWKLVERGSFWR